MKYFPLIAGATSVLLYALFKVISQKMVSNKIGANIEPEEYIVYEKNNMPFDYFLAYFCGLLIYGVISFILSPKILSTGQINQLGVLMEGTFLIISMLVAVIFTLLIGSTKVFYTNRRIVISFASTLIKNKNFYFDKIAKIEKFKTLTGDVVNLHFKDSGDKETLYRIQGKKYFQIIEKFICLDNIKEINL